MLLSETPPPAEDVIITLLLESKAKKLEVVAVPVEMLTKFKPPEMFIDPVKWCKSSKLSPNFVEPVAVMLTTFLFVTFTLYSFAFTAPETFNVPVKFKEEPSKVKLDSADMVPSPSAVKTRLFPSFAMLTEEIPSRAIVTNNSVSFYPGVVLANQQRVEGLQPQESFSAQFTYPAPYYASRGEYAFGIYADIDSETTEPAEDNASQVIVIPIDNECG